MAYCTHFWNSNKFGATSYPLSLSFPLLCWPSGGPGCVVTTGYFDKEGPHFPTCKHRPKEGGSHPQRPLRQLPIGTFAMMKIFTILHCPLHQPLAVCDLGTWNVTSETAELKCTSCFILTDSNINSHMWLVAIVLDGAALREILQRSSLRGRAGGSHKYVCKWH